MFVSFSSYDLWKTETLNAKKWHARALPLLFKLLKIERSVNRES